MEALALAVAAAVAGAALTQSPRAWRWAAARARARHRQVQCAGCGRDLPARNATRVGERFEAHDGGAGGTAVVTDWHRRCARRAGVA